VPDRATPDLSGLTFRGEWRRYQLLALEAFERDRAAGRRHTHLVAPPGSGKTVLGIEMARRIGRPALALVPNTAIQAQWLRAGADSLRA
jgi:superfamily II DNA or RNA helicase